MDPTRFDSLTRALSDLTDRLPSRRGLLRGLGASLLGVATHAGLTDDSAAAKRGKGKGKGKKHSCPTGQVRCNRRCTGCCSDADCGGNACVNGTCSRCPAGLQLCRGGCIAETACCSDADCSGNRVCTDGGCACAPSDRLCEGVCISRRECCGTDCPPNGGGGGGGGGGTPQVCTPETCNGCCDGTQCREGVTANNCGRGGTDCAVCAAGESCTTGVCTTGGTCSPESCGGCCDRGECREGDSQNFCGRNGVTCLPCRSREACDAGTCVCPTECCGDEDCTAAPGGTCQSDGTCAYACVPTDVACVYGVNACCHPDASCGFGGVCEVCIPTNAACTPGARCCDPVLSCSGGFCT